MHIPCGRSRSLDAGELSRSFFENSQLTPRLTLSILAFFGAPLFMAGKSWCQAAVSGLGVKPRCVDGVAGVGALPRARWSF